MWCKFGRMVRAICLSGKVMVNQTISQPTADSSITFSNTLMQPGGEDFLRELTEFMLNRIIEVDVTQRINADPHERSDELETYHNGYCDRQ